LSLEPEVGGAESNHARLFIAIHLPDAVRMELRRVQEELKEHLPRHGAAWTRPESMHLTLRFLGNVPTTDIARLTDKLCETVTAFGELPLTCERLGCFPDLRYPRVVWAWVHDEADALTRLFHRIDETVSQFAEKPAEKRFTGHITLARLKQIKRPDTERLAQFVEGAVKRQFGKWTAKSVSLIQSQLGQTGATYTELCSAALR
jgi:2'-5' RNA ligase